MHSGLLFIILCCIVCIESIPKFSTPCRKHDTVCFNKVSNELFKAAIIGDPALGAEVLDPAFKDSIKGEFGILEYKLYNTTLVGFKDCVVNNATLSEDQSQLSFVLRCPLLDFKGAYETRGQLFSLHLAGKGQFTLECKDYIVTFDGKIKTLKREDGKEYLAVNNFKANGDLIGGMKFHLYNLFDDGEKELEEIFYRVVNENWKVVSKELQVPIVDVNVKRAIINLNKILKEVTLEAMYIDE